MLRINFVIDSLIMRSKLIEKGNHCFYNQREFNPTLACQYRCYYKKNMLDYKYQNPFDRKYLLPPQSHLYSSNISPISNKRPIDYLYYSRIECYPLISHFRDDFHHELVSSNQVNKDQKIATVQESQVRAIPPWTNIENGYSKYVETDQNPFLRKSLLTGQIQGKKIQKHLNQLQYIYLSSNYSSYGENVDQKWLPRVYNHYQIYNEGSIQYNVKTNLSNNILLEKLPSSNLLMKRSYFNKTSKQSYESHKNYKELITVRGQKFFKAQVFPPTT